MRRPAPGEHAENRQVAYLSSPDVRSSIQRVLEVQGLFTVPLAELDRAHRRTLPAIFG